QLTTNDARCGQPKHDLELLGGISEALAQLARTSEVRHRMWRGRPLGSDEAWSQCELEIKLPSVLPCAVGQTGQDLDAFPQVCDGLEVGGAHGCLLACLEPIISCLFEQSRLRKVERESLGLGLHNFRESLLEDVCDGGMQRGASALQ